ncbi:MAG: hypothetical protein ABIC68_06155 [Candidatus Omnitrophota bacterium]
MSLEYKIKLNDAAGPEVRISEISQWSGKFNVYINGSLVKSLEEKKKSYPIAMPDGSVKKMFVKRIIFDPAPKIEIDGKEILLARKLFWYEHVLALTLPFLLLLSGGAIGGACGGGAACFNYRVLRGSSSWLGKIFKIAGISFAAFICYMVIYLLVLGFIQAMTGGPVKAA